MKSMTGFGNGQSKTALNEISVVVKSVNGRFLDTRFHLPREYFSLEQQLKKRMSKVFSRGTVDIYINRQTMGRTDVRWDKGTAQKWLTAYKEISQSMGLTFQPSQFIDKLSTLPHVFSVRDQQSLGSREKKMLIETFTKAMRACDEERRREGRSLQKHLAQILRELVVVVHRMEALRERLKVDHSSRFQQKLQKLGLEGQVDPQRFAQELIIYLDKGEIAEELERLKEHLRMCQQYLKSGEEQGKKLDFYTQELLREVNTIGSKANNAQLTEHVVLAKSLIEAFKEQVQNVE